MLRRGAVTSRQSAPVTKVLRQYTRGSLPNARRAGEMFPTLESRGFDRDLLRLFYNFALATARYDDHGHILPAHLGIGACGLYATTPDEHCGAGQGVKAGGPPPDPKSGPAVPGGGRPEQKAAAPTPAPTAPPASGAPAPSPAPAPAPAPEPGGLGVPLLDYLLR